MASAEEIRAAAIASVGPYNANGTVRVPGLARCISGTKGPAVVFG